MLISITVIALKIQFEKHYHPEVCMCHYMEAIFVGEDVYKHLQFFFFIYVLLCRCSYFFLIVFYFCFFFGRCSIFFNSGLWKAKIRGRKINEGKFLIGKSKSQRIHWVNKICHFHSISSHWSIVVFVSTGLNMKTQVNWQTLHPLLQCFKVFTSWYR